MKLIHSLLNLSFIKTRKQRYMASQLWFLGSILGGLMLTTSAYADVSEDTSGFQFGFFGDTGYRASSVALIPDLIKSMNEDKSLKFVVHVGDIKGNQTCDTAIYTRVLSEFNSSAHPLLYTPGDNDWTDCANQPPLTTGAVTQLPLRDPLNALNEVRQLFYLNTDGRSFGKHTIKPKSQNQKGDNPDTTSFDESKFVENQMWIKGDILFVTIHVVGSRDNCVMQTIPTETQNFYNPLTQIPTVAANAALLAGIPGTCSNEEKERKNANLAWLDAAFAKAMDPDNNIRGVVILSQADLRYDLDNDDGSCLSSLSAANLATCKVFQSYRESINSHAFAFKKPVAYLYGDSHSAKRESPVLSLPLFQYVQTFGQPNTGWIHVNVNPLNPLLFEFKIGTCIVDVAQPTSVCPAILPGT